MTPKLSVITACHNHGRYLAECMRSVRAQTATEIEHIVIIDGATDDSWSVAEGLRATDDRLRVIVNDRNRGLAYSQNRGITLARSPWVLKVDADDAIGSTYVAEILDAADADPRRNVIFSPCFDGELTKVYRYPAFDPRRIIDTLMIAGCAAIRRDVCLAVGGLDETLPFAEDWDLYIRAQLAVGLTPHQLPEPRWFYRHHDGPRASTRGIARLPDLQRYWRGHTRESALGGTRSWGQWCAEHSVAA